MNVVENNEERAAAFSEIYALFYKPGVSFLTHLLKDKEEAENMVQEVFVKLWLNRDNLVFDVNLKPYFFRSLKNIAFDYFKTMEKDQLMKDTYLKKMKDLDESGPQEKEEISRAVNQAIDQLSDKRRQILRLTYIEKKSYQEIAKRMGISKNTVKNQLIKAKKLLRVSIPYPIGI